MTSIAIIPPGGFPSTPLPSDFVEADEVVRVSPHGNLTRRVLVPNKVIVADNALAPAQCRAWIEAAEEKGFVPSLIRNGVVRNNRKAEFISQGTADALLDDAGVRLLVPDQMPDGRRFVGLWNKIRVFKYGPGEFFVPHLDGGNMSKLDYSTSIFTLVIYLNDDFTGGSTTLLQMPEFDMQPRSIEPRTGRALLFAQREVIHEGTPIVQGYKYLIQVSIMYTAAKGKEGVGAPFFQLVNAGYTQHDHGEYDA